MIQSESGLVRYIISLLCKPNGLFSHGFVNPVEDAGDWYCAMVVEDSHRDTIWSLAVAPGSGRIVSSSADKSIAILRNFTIMERREMFPDQSNCS